MDFFPYTLDSQAFVVGFCHTRDRAVCEGAIVQWWLQFNRAETDPRSRMTRHQMEHHFVVH